MARATGACLRAENGRRVHATDVSSARSRIRSLEAGGIDGGGRSIGTAVLGAGPAGLTGAYALALRGAKARVFEADGVVGGLAKTVEFNGYRFDLGGHRFFTKLKPIERLWEDVLGDEFLRRPRLSRLYYRGDFYAYPLVAKDVVARLGLIEAALYAFSYLGSRLRPRPEPKTFEDWATLNFGGRLYDP